MGKEGRRFLPNLKKLGSPRLNLDEDIEVEHIEYDYNKPKYIFQKREIKNSFTLSELLDDDIKAKLKEVLDAKYL